jgi:ABC-type multidrug transport system ATPase subunit
VLRVEGLSKSYFGLEVLGAVTFRIGHGEAMAVVGPNGAGKSTLLRCVVGAEAPDTGAVLLDGEPLRETSASARAAVAAVLDDADYFPDLSIVEHLRLLAWAHGNPDAEPAVQRVLEELGLAPLRDRLPTTLSTGQRHRLGLASCLVRPRRLVVLDEPEQRLDSTGVRWLIDRLLAEKAAGTAILFASHSAEVVDAVADAVLPISA